MEFLKLFFLFFSDCHFPGVFFYSDVCKSAISCSVVRLKVNLCTRCCAICAQVSQQLCAKKNTYVTHVNEYGKNHNKIWRKRNDEIALSSCLLMNRRSLACWNPFYIINFDRLWLTGSITVKIHWTAVSYNLNVNEHAHSPLSTIKFTIYVYNKKMYTPWARQYTCDGIKLMMGKTAYFF